MKKTKSWSFVIIIVAILLATTAFALYTKNKPQPTSSQDKKIENSTNTDDTKISLNGKLFFAAKNDKATTIYEKNFSKDRIIKIFTDTDEGKKIRSLGGIGDNKILSFNTDLEEEHIGELAGIILDSSGKKDIFQKEFASTQPPIISPNGEKIAYTLFSNAEKDFGFKLIVANKDNSNKIELDNDPTNLTIFSWNYNSNELCYSKGNSENEQKVFTIDIKEKKSNEFLTFKGYINSLYWGKTDKFVASMQEKGSEIKKTELYYFTLKKPKPEKITDNDTYENYPVLSPDGENIAFFSTSTDNKPTSNQNGEIKIININSKETNKVADGNNIVGWIE